MRPKQPHRRRPSLLSRCHHRRPPRSPQRPLQSRRSSRRASRSLPPTRRHQRHQLAGIEAAAGVNAAGEKIGPLGVGISPKNSSRGSARKPPPPIKEEDEAARAASVTTQTASTSRSDQASQHGATQTGGWHGKRKQQRGGSGGSRQQQRRGSEASTSTGIGQACACDTDHRGQADGRRACPAKAVSLHAAAQASGASHAGGGSAGRATELSASGTSLAIEKAAAAVGIGSPRDSSKLLSQSDRTPGARAKPAGHALSGVDSYRARGAVNQTPGVFIPASMSYRATDEKIRTQRYLDTPAISIGVNQSSRSPSRMSAASGLKSPTPAGGLFSFSIPAASVSKALTARERFELTSRADYRKKEVIPLDQLGVTEITQEEYVTPRAQIPDPAAHDVKVTISKVGGASRIKGLSKFFEQFSDPGLEA